jgi:hypothetical protein
LGAARKSIGLSPYLRVLLHFYNHVFQTLTLTRPRVPLCFNETLIEPFFSPRATEQLPSTGNLLSSTVWRVNAFLESLRARRTQSAGPRPTPPRPAATSQSCSPNRRTLSEQDSSSTITPTPDQVRKYKAVFSRFHSGKNITSCQNIVIINVS